METYRILISDFETELSSFDISWLNRKFRWVTEDSLPPDAMHDYLTALADNTKKPIAACLTLAAQHAFPDASVTIMTPSDIAKADAVPAVVSMG